MPSAKAKYYGPDYLVWIGLLVLALVAFLRGWPWWVRLPLHAAWLGVLVAEEVGWYEFVARPWR